MVNNYVQQLEEMANDLTSRVLEIEDFFVADSYDQQVYVRWLLHTNKKLIELLEEQRRI